ncbi:MAG: aminodeoxychorismate lyase [Endozoicomonas sp.]
MSTAVWINGRPGSSIPVNDRGLAYGDGVFETVRVASGRPVMAELHWRRLSDSARRLGIELCVEQVENEVGLFLTELPDSEGVLKLIVTRGSGGRGYNPSGSGPARRILSFHPLPEYPSNPAFEGIRLYPCKTRLGNSSLAGLKHLNRLENVMARSEWQGGECLEGLVLDWEGRPVEGTMSNLFLVKKDGLLVTPLLDHCGVKGVCREYILEQASGWGLKVFEQAVQLSDLERASEVFTCNSVNGVWPVVAFRDIDWPVGPVTCDVRDRILDELNV